jgi:hypothetical protein
MMLQGFPDALTKAEGVLAEFLMLKTHEKGIYHVSELASGSRETEVWAEESRAMISCN